MRGTFRIVAPLLLCLGAVAFAVTQSGPAPDATADPAADYDLWAMDRGTHIVHIFSSGLEEIGTIDLGAQGARVPPMFEFTRPRQSPTLARFGRPVRRRRDACAGPSG
jgi:hypothetical protein